MYSGRRWERRGLEIDEWARRVLGDASLQNVKRGHEKGKSLDGRWQQGMCNLFHLEVQKDIFPMVCNQW
jgi:hypothetical protein